LILFNQNIVWGLLTKFCTKIDSYKKDVYRTTGISNLSVIFKMATKMPKNWPCLKQCSGYKVSNFCSISLKVMTLTFLKMQFGGYFWGHRWTRHIMFALYINFSAFWWPFWKSQPNWKFRKFRKHPSCRNLFLCQI
jgi:hypothetical protein